ncbi:MAG: hypothetical protein K1X88_13820 [Nannocystaceae bacterium]|nr:hypothetical protein [Nannocystaceae bacterium]
MPGKTLARLLVVVASLGGLSCGGQQRLAPDAAEREIGRLLASAAAHASQSSACVDGRGEKVTIDGVVVTAGDSANRFSVAYRLTVAPEGDTRGCEQPCRRYEPTVTNQTLEIEFAQQGSGHHIVVPAAFPGLELVTPLGQPHDGDCLPDAPPFEPAVL